MNTKFRSKKRILLEGTQAVLIANGYRWGCPKCNHHNYTMVAMPIISCAACTKVFTVAEVCHLINGDSLLPGTVPDLLYLTHGASKRTASEEAETQQNLDTSKPAGSITLIASGYSWRCPECDTMSFIKSASMVNVSCENCLSKFSVSDIRHRVDQLDLGVNIHPGAKWKMQETPVQEDGDESLPRLDDLRSFFS